MDNDAVNAGQPTSVSPPAATIPIERLPPPVPIIRPLSPPVFVKHFLPDGGMLNLEIFLDSMTRKEMVQCDRCGRFISVSANTRNTTGLSAHRTSKECEKVVKARKKARDRRERNEAAVRDMRSPQVAVKNVGNAFIAHNPEAGSSAPKPTMHTVAAPPLIPSAVAPVLPSVYPPTGTSTLSYYRNRPEPTGEYSSRGVPHETASTILPPGQQHPSSTSSLAVAPHPSGTANYTYPKAQTGPSSAGSTSAGTSTAQVKCAGVVMRWTPGSIWDTYPFQQHRGGKLPWNVIGFEQDERLRIQSKKCGGYVKPQEMNGASCRNCLALLNCVHMRKLQKMAEDIQKNTSYSYYNNTQLIQKVSDLAKDNSTLRLKTLNLEKKVRKLEGGPPSSPPPSSKRPAAPPLFTFTPRWAVVPIMTPPSIPPTTPVASSLPSPPPMASLTPLAITPTPTPPRMISPATTQSSAKN